MTRLEALKELLAKVEAGTLKRSDLWPSRGTPEGLCGRNSRAWWAYKGSLDAAKALHKAVLRGWAVERLTMWPGTGGMCCVSIWGTHDHDGERWHRFDDGRAEGKSDIPARAWLIAIIKALIAMEQPA